MKKVVKTVIDDGTKHKIINRVDLKISRKL